MKLKQQSFIDLSNKKKDITLKKTTPMMAQYLEVKSRHQEYLLFYRMGDFYELFFEDAKIASYQLGITLTKRGKLNNIDIPMCGVPYHSVQTYLARLIKLGFKIAIAEQLVSKQKNQQDVKKSTKIFSRDVVRIITPGTLLEEPLLEAKQYNFLASIYIDKGEGSLSWSDMTTSVVNIKSLDNKNLVNDLNESLFKIEPSEIIIHASLKRHLLIKDIIKFWQNKITIVPNSAFDEKNNIEKLKVFFRSESLESIANIPKTGICSAGSLIDYLETTQKNNIPNIPILKIEKKNDFMEIDKISNQSLELFQKMNGEKNGSLLNTLDHTISASGARMLKEQLKNPLLQVSEINKRLDFVDSFINEGQLIDQVRDQLKGLSDVERALSRVSAKTMNPRDILIISNFINKTIVVFDLLNNSKNIILRQLLLNPGEINQLMRIERLIKEYIIENPPVSIREGGVIGSKISKQLNQLRNIKKSHKEKIVLFQMNYSKITGVSNLKIKFNNFHGYFIETTNKNAFNLTECSDKKFQLIQNTINSSRFQTEELKKTSREIEESAFEAIELEKKLYDNLCEKVLDHHGLIMKSSELVSYIDVMSNYAFLSKKRNYVRPIFSEERTLEIIEGRHPVVEASLIGEEKKFIPNDCKLTDTNQTWLMTGPNMAGKSTFLRQVALLTIMSQIGCFVPARSIKIGIVDKIFTRVGASDDLSQGLSTFMTEMVETARILNGATQNSLVILDELGRGTSNSDGLAIAWAILEFFASQKKCPILFATHYNELTEIKKNINDISLKTLKTKNWKGDVIFLYKVIDGISQSSFGLHVAKLAGIQPSIINRAKVILMNLKKNDSRKEIKIDENLSDHSSKDELTKVNELLELIKRVDPNQITPKEALDLIFSIKNGIK